MGSVSLSWFHQHSLNLFFLIEVWTLPFVEWYFSPRSLFPKDSESFRKFWNHLVDFIILHGILDQKYNISGEKYLKWHYWTKTMCKNCIIDRPIAETFRNFWNVLESFGNHNPSWKRPLSLFGILFFMWENLCCQYLLKWLR